MNGPLSMSNFFQQFTRLFADAPPEPYQAALEAARRARCGGAFQTALDEALRARSLARFAEQQAEALFEAARACISLGDFERARTLADELGGEAAPERARALRLIALGESATAQGRTDEARDQFELAIKLVGRLKEGAATQTAALARGLLAEAALIDGGGRYATHLLNEALMTQSTASDPGLTQWLTGLLGEAMFERSTMNESVRLLKAATNLADVCGCVGDARRWRLRLGEAAIQEGQLAVALGYFNQALEGYDPKPPTGAYVRALLAKARVLLTTAGAAGSAEAEASARLALAAAAILGDAALTAQAEGLVGEALLAQGQSEAALSHLRAAGANAPADTRRALARALLLQGSVEEGMALYAAAVADAERRLNQNAAASALAAASLRRDWGLALQGQGHDDGAITVWMPAVALYESANAPAAAARLLCDLALARRQGGSIARALRDIEAALVLLNSVDRNDHDTRGVVLANAGLMYAETADAESADSFLKEAITLAEKAHDVQAQCTRLGNYGWYLLMVGRPRRAQATLESALVLSQQHSLNPQHAVQTDNLGLVHESLGEFPRALELHQRALALPSGPAWQAQFAANAANTLISMGQADEALALLELYPPEARPHDAVLATDLARARALQFLGRADEAAALITGALALARQIDHRRWLAEALAAHSRLLALRGDMAAAQEAWDEAKKLYLLRHMPQGKISPDWLAPTPSEGGP